MLAQGGRLEEAMAALRQAERLAASVQAQDVLGIISNNQANVAMLQHRHEQALALAERECGAAGTARARSRSRDFAHQRSDRFSSGWVSCSVRKRCSSAPSSRGARSQFNEITGAVYDSLAQIALTRGGYEAAGDYLRQAGEAYGSYGGQTGLWYEWSIRVLEAKLAARRGASEEALRLANEIAAKAPPAEAIQAELIACEALLAGGRTLDAEKRIGSVASRIDARAMPGSWGEFLRLRGTLHGSADRLSEAYHDIAQSASVFELIGEGYQLALSHLALGRLASRVGARSQAEHQFALAGIDVRIPGRRARSRRDAESRVAIASRRGHRSALLHRCR